MSFLRSDKLSCNSGAPLYEPNNQTGGVQDSGWMKETKAGTHTVLHEKAHPSRVWLPVMKPAG